MKQHFTSLVLIACLISTVGTGQHKSAKDSLHRILAIQTGEDRYRTLYELTFEYAPSDKKLALKFINEAELLSKDLGDSLWIVKAKRVKGQLLYLLEAIDTADLVFQRALPIAIRHEFLSEQLAIEVGLGQVNLWTGRYDKALLLFMNAHLLASQLGERQYTLNTMNFIGLTYYKLKDYQNGLRYFLAALDSMRLPNTRIRHNILGNAALCYAHLGEFKLAHLFLEKVVREYGRESDGLLPVDISYAFGVAYMLEGRLKTAEEYFIDSYLKAKKDGNVRFQLDNIYLLSELYIDAEQYRKAGDLLQQAEQIVQVKNSYKLEVMKIYARLSEYYATRRQEEKAYLYLRQYSNIRDELYSEELIHSLMKAEATVRQRENEVKIATQEQLLGLNKELLKRQRVLNLLTWVVVALATIIILYLVRNYKRNRILNILLNQRVRERTQELEATQKGLTATLRTQEHGLQRVASEVLKYTATVKGLCGVARNESSQSHAMEYFDRIDEASCQLHGYVQSTLRHIQSSQQGIGQ